jgi:hypothetical protein
MEINSFKYTENYCEENIWQLCQHPDLKEYTKKVLFISNQSKNCAFHFQKSAIGNAPVCWDYHVILLASKNNRQLIYDFDSTLSLPTELQNYIDSTFESPADGNHPEFKSIESDDYVSGFNSDREHMKDAGGNWIFEPPLWPIIETDNELPLQELMDFSGTSKQTIFNLAELMVNEKEVKIDL